MQELKVFMENDVIEISNDKYTNVNCDDMSMAPDIGVEYKYLQVSDAVWYENYYIDLNNSLYEFEEEKLQELLELLANWEQPEGQEGNPTLEQLQVLKRTEIKEAMESELREGYKCPSTEFLMDATLDDISKLKAGYDLEVAAGSESMDIRDYNNTTHSDVALEDVNNMVLELGLNYKNALVKKWGKDDEILSATDKETVEDVTWN